MKSESGGSFAAYVGVDWADSKHDFCLQAADSDRREPGVVAHTPEAIADWASGLRRRFAGPIAVCLEIAKGLLINALPRSMNNASWRRRKRFSARSELVERNRRATNRKASAST